MFNSDASNLVSGDTEGHFDIFLHDTQDGTTTRVSANLEGMQGNGDSFSPSVSADGCYVVYYSEANNLVSGDTNDWNDIFLHDRQTGVTQRISLGYSGDQANGWSEYPTISADGRYSTFFSLANNLVSDDTHGWIDIFVHDMQSGITKRISEDARGNQATGDSYWPSISGNGLFVAFTSIAPNLVGGDTNNSTDVFVVPVKLNNFQIYLPVMIQ